MVFATLSFAGCAPVSPEDVARDRVRAALDRLPRCTNALSDEGSVTLIWSCEQGACGEDTCCNECQLRQARVLSETGTRPSDTKRVSEVLQLAPVLSSCETVGVDAALVGVTMAFDPVACVVR